MIHDTNTSPLPVFFGNKNQLFGWLHFDQSVKSQSAVIICSPVGYEQVRTHATVREMSDTLAKDGHTVFRFDYPSTGDSLDLDGKPGHVNAWMDSIREAIQFVDGVANSKQTTLIGIRMGATLARCVAEDVEVGALVLWEPVLSGKIFCREMQILESAALPKQRKRGTEQDIDAGGFVISAETQDSLRQIVLGRNPAIASPPTLLLERDDLRSNDQRLNALLKSGSDVSRQHTSGFKQMMLAPQDSEVPWETIRVIKGWLTEQVESKAENLTAQADQTEQIDIGQFVSQCSSGSLEQAVRFGPNGRLFGILTRGRAKNDHCRATMITLCGGAVPHYSANRMYVPLARRLAARGFDVFRMDLSGIGDSQPVPEGPRRIPYTETTCDDIQSAMDTITEMTGATRFSLLGLCSGAFAAMQMARESDRISRIILVNQLVYFVSRQEYEKLAHGKIKAATDLDFPRSKGLLGRIVRKLIRTTGVAGAVAGRLMQDYLVGGPLARDLQGIARKSIRISFIHSEDDPAVDALLLPASRTVRKLIRSRSATLTTIPDTDHTFSPASSQGRLLTAVEDILDDRQRT